MLLFAACFVFTLGGCGGDTPPEVVESAERLSTIQELQDKVQAQQQQLLMKEAQLKRQAVEIRELRARPTEIPLDDLIHVEKVGIDSLSGGYDDDRDGRPDGIRVYLRLYNQFNGKMRATGKAEVRLLDLSQPAERQVVGQITLDKDELNKCWYGALLSSEHYTISVPWKDASNPPLTQPITVLVSFSDLLSGRTFDAQRVVKVVPE